MDSSSSIPFGDFAIREGRDSDLPAIKRIWRECGWHPDSNEQAIEDFYSAGSVLVADLDGEAECSVLEAPGLMRYLDDDIRLSAVLAVNTSHVARKRGLGLACTAHSLAKAARRGAEVAALGIFDQGYYDRLGFGGGSYERTVCFDPADLNPEKIGEFRVPRRLAQEDWKHVTHAMQTRWLGHGGCVLDPPAVVKAEMALKPGSFGLGYFDDEGQLTHFFYGTLEGENGPLRIAAIAYRNGHQLLELFALLRSLSDQVSCVVMLEPPHIQLQDLLQQPFRQRRVTQRSAFENSQSSSSFWQFRILDVEKCVGKTHLYGPPCEFNLTLTDPLSSYLRDASEWNGANGDYTIQLGEDSSASAGHKTGLPTLRASVNAFSRLWLGVRPATHLLITDDLESDSETLLSELDDVLRLPPACCGWYF